MSGSGDSRNLSVPEDLMAALSAMPETKAAWDALTPIGQRDFIGWINSAKTSATRAKRIHICCDKLLSGKRRPCCYAVVPMDLYKALGESPEAKAEWSKLSSDEKRDYSDWIEESADKAERKVRVGEAIRRLETKQDACQQH